MSNLLVSSDSAGEYPKRFRPLFGAGNSGRKNSACGDKRLVGITPPTNGSRRNWPATAGLGRVVSGSKIGRPALKSPFKAWALGMVELKVVPCRVRPPS